MVFIISPLCKIAPLERHYKKSRLVLPKKKCQNSIFMQFFIKSVLPVFLSFHKKSYLCAKIKQYGFQLYSDYQRLYGSFCNY